MGWGGGGGRTPLQTMHNLGIFPIAFDNISEYDFSTLTSALKMCKIVIAVEMPNRMPMTSLDLVCGTEIILNLRVILPSHQSCQ